MDNTTGGTPSMRILLLAPSLPDPADRSPSSYTLHALQHLARDHDVTLLAGRRGPVDLAVVRALRRVCARVETAPLGESLPQGVATLAASITAGRLRAVGREGGGAFREVLDRLLRTERFDLIHCEGLAAAQMIPAFWAGPIVLDERGASWRPRLRQAEAQFGAARRWTRGRDARTLHEGEIAACRRAAVTLVRCAADRALLEDAIGTSWSVHVVPIGVDVAAWEPVWFRRDPQPGRVLTAMDGGA